MWRGLLALLILSSPAAAQVPPSGRAAFPCPYATIGWSLQWPITAKITSASYDTGTDILYIVFYGTIVQAFANVPVGIMQSLSYTQYPVALYNTTIIHYHQILLSEKDNCPMQWEFGGAPTGYIWTD